ncbi:CLUMA_CG018555, isoform A [Clunio marinus]|uniref:CLUMA_CG018555, isoform A n=1 Tax=Clunio marinus TaxID=568069 RepID=A0A1J1IZD4_9DIPT|nr:CLUMA_CG018555, isoform A [Clunio marinus]
MRKKSTKEISSNKIKHQTSSRNDIPIVPQLYTISPVISHNETVQIREQSNAFSIISESSTYAIKTVILELQNKNARESMEIKTTAKPNMNISWGEIRSGKREP